MSGFIFSISVLFLMKIFYRVKKRNEDLVKERMQKTLAHESRIRENQVCKLHSLHIIFF